MKKCDVIVTYCWNRVGYAILRSLSAQGLNVYAADMSSFNICSASRFCAGSFVYPDPFKNESGFIACLLEKIKELKPRVLFPTHDESIVIAKHIDEFPKDLIIPIESFRKMTDLSKKDFATAIAQSVQVPTPLDVDENSVESYPVVFKLTVSNSAKHVFYPKNVEELNDLKKQFAGKPYLVQSIVQGTDFSVDCLRWNGSFYASVYRALITKTVGGGTSTQRMIVDFPELVEFAKRILDKVDYKGVCGLDFKVNEDNGKIAFLEVNARFTGGLATPIKAGFDIPYMLYSLAVNGSYNEKVNINIGTKTKWLLGDVITLCGRMLSRKLSFKELREIFRFRGFDGFDDFRWDDKKIILGEMNYYFSKLVKNRKLNP